MSIDLFIIKPTRCTNFANLFWHEILHFFGQFFCPSSGVYSMYTQQWYMSYRFVDSYRAGNQLDALISQIYFGMKFYTYRTVLLPIIRSLFTVDSAMVYVIQVCRQLSSRTILVFLESCLQTCMTYTIAECTLNKLLMVYRRNV